MQGPLATQAMATGMYRLGVLDRFLPGPLGRSEGWRQTEEEVGLDAQWSYVMRAVLLP